MHRANIIVSLLLVAWCCTPRAEAQIAIIGHAALEGTTIDKNELLDLYLGEVRTWKDGTPVVLFDLPRDHDVRDAFFDYLGKRPSRMQTVWLRNLLSGDADPPETADDEEALLEYIRTTRGAIGFIRSQLVTDSVYVLLVIPTNSS